MIYLAGYAAERTAGCGMKEVNLRLRLFKRLFSNGVLVFLKQTVFSYMRPKNAAEFLISMK